MRIVDDDVSWSSLAAGGEQEEEEDEADLPVVAEFVDERPDEVKLMEEFRTNTKWKLLGDQNEDSQSSDISVPAKSTARRQRHDSPDNTPPRQLRHDSPDLSPPRRERNNSPSLLPPRQQRHDSPDLSPPRRKRHDSPDLSPPRRKRHDSPDPSAPNRQRHDSPDLSPPRRKRHDSPDVSPKRVSSATGKKGCKTTEKSLSGGMQGGEQPHLRHGFSDKSSSRQKRQATPDLSPPRKKRDDSDPDSSPRWQKRSGSPSQKKPSRTKGASPDTKKPRHVPSPQRCLRHDSYSPPPRRATRNASDADLSPQRKDRRTLPTGKDQQSSRSPTDLLPHHHRDSKGSPKKANMMMSGVKAGLVSADVLRREQQELKKRERSNKRLEEESRHTETVFRDKSGRKRDLAQERLEQKQKDEAKSERDEQYARWGKGLAQGRQQQQNVEDAIKEMQKPLARYIDDQDLDRMLREQEREGDPMADFIKKRKAKENKEKKEKPRYNGPAPPLNRFNIWPGHRWDGVDRSNGFEQQRFARIANKKAVQELAYKWSVEDM
nr:BUD13 homolog isoform X4 [Anser cygnoides]